MSNFILVYEKEDNLYFQKRGTANDISAMPLLI